MTGCLDPYRIFGPEISRGERASARGSAPRGSVGHPRGLRGPNAHQPARAAALGVRARPKKQTAEPAA